MSEIIHHEPVVPKGGVLAGAGALILFTLAAVTTVRLTGVGWHPHDAAGRGRNRDLRFEDGQYGAVLVFDAATINWWIRWRRAATDLFAW